ncbi:MAG: hypothetical protein ACRDFS_06560 [Chloroflexota bacterium]
MKFYASVRRRAEGIDNAEGKQRIVLELYEKFFKTALPQVTDRLGIVYTPASPTPSISMRPATPWTLCSSPRTTPESAAKGLPTFGL